jgi:drug/metabolite transporter (DMT)-like permease
LFLEHLFCSTTHSNSKNTVFVGDFFFLCASALSGFYLVYVDQKKIDPLLASALVAVISGVVVLGFYSVFPQESNLRKIPPRELVFHIFYQSLLIGGLIVLCLTFAASYLGSQKTSFFVAAIPVAALLCGKWIAGDPIHHFEVFAMIIVTFGILIGSITTGSK